MLKNNLLLLWYVTGLSSVSLTDFLSLISKLWLSSAANHTRLQEEVVQGGRHSVQRRPTCDRRPWAGGMRLMTRRRRVLAVREGQMGETAPARDEMWAWWFSLKNMSSLDALLNPSHRSHRLPTPASCLRPKNPGVHPSCAAIANVHEWSSKRMARQTAPLTPPSTALLSPRDAAAAAAAATAAAGQGVCHCDEPALSKRDGGRRQRKKSQQIWLSHTNTHVMIISFVCQALPSGIFHFAVPNECGRQSHCFFTWSKSAPQSAV